MKRGQYLSYDFFEKIDHGSPLAQFFNQVFHELHLARMISAPAVFDKTAKEFDSAERFYQTCLFEVYAHAVIRKLEEWIRTTSEYLFVFNGSWEYYARSKRIEAINEYGGDNEDYNTDGSVKTDAPTKTLQPYSVIGDLVNDDWRDIATQTTCEDLADIYAYINIGGAFSIREMLNALGAPHIKSYRQENGKMVENTTGDELLHKVQKQDKCENMSGRLMVVVGIIKNIADEIKSLPFDDDNIEYFRKLGKRAQNVLDMNLSEEAQKLIDAQNESGNN